MSWFKRIPSLYADPDVTSRRLRIFYAVALAIYAAITFYTMLNHEPWRDEAFVWLMARDLSFSDLFHELRYNGSPGLWHTIIFLLNRLQLPYESQQYLHWALACAAASVFLYRAPFHPLLKLLFIFSYFIIYEHAVIVRVYLITIALIYAVCILEPKKFQQCLRYALCIALLANASFFGLASAAYLGCVYLYRLFAEKLFSRRRCVALAIMLTGGLISCASMWPPSDGFRYYQQAFPLYNPLNALYGFAIGLVYPYWTDYMGLLLASGVVIAPLLLAPLIWLLCKRRAYAALGLLISMWLAILYIAVFKYIWPSPRHYNFFLIFAIASLWLAYYRRAQTSMMAERMLFVLLAVMLSCQVIASAHAIRDDIKRPFSGSYNMASYITDNKLEHNIIVGYPSAHAATILPYLPDTKIWYAQQQQFGTWIHFDSHARDPLTKRQVIERAQQQFPDLSQVLFLFKDKMHRRLPWLKLVHFSHGMHEAISLYQIQPERMTPTSLDDLHDDD